MLLDGDFHLGAHDLCVTKSTGDLHSKAMDTWNTPASLAGPLLTAFWVLSFFSYPYFNILPQDSFLCSFILFIYFLIFYYLWEILFMLCGFSYHLYANINKPFFFLLSLTSFLNTIYSVAHRTFPLDGLISNVIMHSVSRRTSLFPLASQTNCMLIQVAHFYKWNHPPNF